MCYSLQNNAILHKFTYKITGNPHCFTSIEQELGLSVETGAMVLARFSNFSFGK